MLKSCRTRVRGLPYSGSDSTQKHMQKRQTYSRGCGRNIIFLGEKSISPYSAPTPWPYSASLRPSFARAAGLKVTQPRRCEATLMKPVTKPREANQPPSPQRKTTAKPCKRRQPPRTHREKGHQPRKANRVTSQAKADSRRTHKGQ